jgi:Rrf2 family protein
MLSQTAEYAVRATLYLAGAGRFGTTVPAETISTALGAPANYLSKTLHQLARAGIVRGMRGPTGGFRLAVAPAELTVARIIELFDGPVTKATCLLGDRPCDPAHPCGAHDRWTAMTAASRAPLAETTLADLLRGDREVEDSAGDAAAQRVRIAR